MERREKAIANGWVLRVSKGILAEVWWGGETIRAEPQDTLGDALAALDKAVGEELEIDG